MLEAAVSLAVVGLIVLVAEGATCAECPDTGACAVELAPDDGVIPNAVDVPVADACGMLKASGNAGWLDYDENGGEDVAVAERYVEDQEPGAGPEDAEGQRVRLVVTGPPDKGATISGPGWVDARPYADPGSAVVPGVRCAIIGRSEPTCGRRSCSRPWSV